MPSSTLPSMPLAGRDVFQPNLMFVQCARKRSEGAKAASGRVELVINAQASGPTASWQRSALGIAGSIARSPSGTCRRISSRSPLLER
jgi:hypothetical protein